MGVDLDAGHGQLDRVTDVHLAVVRALDVQFPRHQQVVIDETPVARTAGAHSVVLHAGQEFLLDGGADSGVLAGFQRMVHQAVERAAHQARPHAQDVRRDEHRQQGVHTRFPGPEHEQAGPLTTPRVVHTSVIKWWPSASSTMDSVRLPLAQKQVADGEIDGRRNEHQRHAAPERFGQDRMQETLHRRHHDEHRRHEDQTALDAAGEELDFLVAVGVRTVGGTRGVPEREPGRSARPRRWPGTRWRRKKGRRNWSAGRPRTSA